MRMKVCIKCGTAKPATSEYFGQNQGTTDGFNGACKVCRNKQQGELYKKNKENNRRVREWVDAKTHFHNSCCFCGVKEIPDLLELIQIRFPADVDNGSKGGLLPVCKTCDAGIKASRCEIQDDYYNWYDEQHFWNEDRLERIIGYLEG